MNSRTSTLILITIIGLGGFIFLVTMRQVPNDTRKIWVFESDIPSSTQDNTVSPINVFTSSRLKITPGVERWYTNSSGTYTFQLPDGFNAPDVETDEPGVTGAVIQQGGKDQLLVLVYKTPPLNTISVSGIEELLDITVSDAKEVFIGTVVRAIQLKTDKGIEVWAIHNGQLYRIMTTFENQDLLDFVLKSWYFAPPVPPAVRKK